MVLVKTCQINVNDVYKTLLMTHLDRLSAKKKIKIDV